MENSNNKNLCKHNKFNYLQFKVRPFSNELKKYNAIFNYLLYDVEEWRKNVLIVEEKWEELYCEILNRINNTNHVEYAEKSNGKYKEVELDDDNFCFECQRLCIAKAPKEDSLSSILRHFRNSVAHGQVYLKDNKYFLFQDLDERKHISARIIINESSLISFIDEVKLITNSK